jgi:hypothetical protein
MSALAIAWTLWGNAASAESALHPWSQAAGVERYRIWVTGLLVGAPLLIERSVSFSHRLLSTDSSWCMSRAASRLTIVSSSWLGAALAVFAWILLIATAAEFGAGGAEEEPLQPAGPALLSSSPSDQEGVVTFEVQAPRESAATALRLPVGLIATGGPSAKLKMRFSRVLSGEFTEEELLVATKRPIQVQIPAGEGALRLELERLGEGALVIVPAERAEWWRPAEGRFKASLNLALLFSMIAITLLAWALGLGTWMRPAAGTGLLLAVAIALCFGGGELGEWGKLLEYVANGDAPAAPSLRAYGLALAAISLGVVLACAGLHRGAQK